jgi:hypothetical protein
MTKPRHPALPAPSEQPRGARRAPPEESLLQRVANDWEKADASAIKALMAGTADAIQQRRAIDWILKSACGMPEWPYVPGDVEATHIHLGRHLVGHQIMKLAQVNLGAVKDREPNADKHEPLM